MTAKAIARLASSQRNALDIALTREFVRLRAEFDALPERFSYDIVVRRHRDRLTVLLAAHKRAAALRFGALTDEALRLQFATSVKADSEPTRAERIAAVFAQLARQVVAGALVGIVAETLARDPLLVAAVEAAILSAPDPAPAVIAQRLLTDKHLATKLATAAASAMLGPVEPPPVENAPAPPAGSPPPPPAPPGAGGAGGGRRSRWRELVERLVRTEAPQRARKIAATSGRVIAEILGQAAAGGWNEERIARMLDAALGLENARYRARRIARTELGSAQNGATLAVARDRPDADDLEKGWLSISDERRRDSHAAAHGQRVPLDQRFVVGEARLDHPGDPSGPLSEIVNCRCGLVIYRRGT